jgi:hypothetical protein
MHSPSPCPAKSSQQRWHQQRALLLECRGRRGCSLRGHASSPESGQSKKKRRQQQIWPRIEVERKEWLPTPRKNVARCNASLHSRHRWLRDAFFAVNALSASDLGPVSSSSSEDSSSSSSSSGRARAFPFPFGSATAAVTFFASAWVVAISASWVSKLSMMARESDATQVRSCRQARRKEKGKERRYLWVTWDRVNGE